MNAAILLSDTFKRKARRYCETMRRLSGADPVDESRARVVVTARTFVAYRLLLDGHTEHSVGAVLGWDHSTINRYRKVARDMLKTPGYETEQKLWKQFNNELI